MRIGDCAVRESQGVCQAECAFSREARLTSNEQSGSDASHRGAAAESPGPQATSRHDLERSHASHDVAVGC